MPVPTLRAAAELLGSASSTAGLASIARSIGCAGDVAPLDRDTRRSLGLDDAVLDAHVAAGPGAIRALLLEIGEEAALRETLPRIAARLAARAPHVLWIVVAARPARGEVAVAAWSGDRRPPRVAALVTDRAHPVDSDAETLRALAAAAGERDILTHARWVEVLGRDSLTARFYRALEASVSALAASAPAGTDDARREAALLDASRLIFLAFLEAKGWLAGDRAFLVRQFEQCVLAGGGFHRRVLRPLFFGTLNTPMHRRAPAAREFGRVPFLNGGLFARASVERSLRGAVFSDDAYGSLLFDVFGQYRFTAREETSSWSEAAVDPEMLGRAFESLMSPSARRRTGAFFTPFSLVEHVSSQALAGALGDDGARVLAGERLSEARRSALLPAIDRLTALDPACGSGAFLVHALERISALRMECGDRRDVSAIRRDVLTRSIFGVDVNPTAVWLCELRLWLSVVIESDETDPLAVTPLPNLDRNVRAGDALAGPSFAAAATRDGAEITRLRERYARSTGRRKETYARRLERAERSRALAMIDARLAVIAAQRRDVVVARRGRDLFGARYHPSRQEHAAATAFRVEATALRASRRRIAALGALPFSFPTHFADVHGRGGFTAIVGNPPWVRAHQVPAEQRAIHRRDFAVARAAAWAPGAASAGAGAGFAAQVDVAALFVERALDLLMPGGTLALLLPVKLWQSLAGGGVRALLAERSHVVRVEDHSRAATAFDAAVYPSLLVARRTDTQGAVEHGEACVELAVNEGLSDGVSWRMPVSLLPFDDSRGAPWLVLPPEARRAFDALRKLGRPLAASPVGRPLLGVKCGRNDAFVVRRIESDGDLAVVETALGRRVMLETGLLRPLLRGEALRPWRVQDGAAAILWTHDSSGAPLRALPPRAARWLGEWRHALASRADARHRSRWWSLFRVDGARCDRARVVWADVGREPRASVLLPGDPAVPLNTCYAARCPSVSDAHALAALLNGPLARAWLNAIAEPARGGFHRYLGWTLSLLPVPHDWSRARDILAPLGESALGGRDPTDRELLDAAVVAYGADGRVMAPLIAWSCS